MPRPTSSSVKFAILLGVILILYAVGVISYSFISLWHRLDTTLSSDIQSVASSLSFAPDGMLRMGNAPSAVDHTLIEVRSLNGNVLYRNECLGDRVVAGPPMRAEGQNGIYLRSDRLHDGQWVRLASRREEIAGRTLLVRVARDEEPYRHALLQLIVALILCWPLSVALGILGWWALGSTSGGDSWRV